MSELTTNVAFDLRVVPQDIGTAKQIGFGVLNPHGVATLVQAESVKTEDDQEHVVIRVTTDAVTPDREGVAELANFLEGVVEVLRDPQVAEREIVPLDAEAPQGADTLVLPEHVQRERDAKADAIDEDFAA